MTEQSRLRIVHLELSEANELVARWHRHHKPAVGHRFSIGVVDENDELRGAVIVGRPVARATDQYAVVEVTRLVTDGCANAPSALYQAAARAAKALGYAATGASRRTSSTASQERRSRLLAGCRTAR